jgi:sugar lactone lactonase YvrE
LRTINDSGAGRVAIDSSGLLYVANFSDNSVAVYPPGKIHPARKITNGITSPYALAIDPSDNLYVANINANSVTVYAPGASSPTKTITDGIHSPRSLVFDHSGNLYVASGAWVSVFNPAGKKLLGIPSHSWKGRSNGLVELVFGP